MVCTLRVLADPTDGAALLRLLTGAALADRPARPGRAAPPGPGDRRAPGAAAADPRRRRAGHRAPTALDEATLVEALDDLGAAAALLGRGLRAGCAALRRRAARRCGTGSTSRCPTWSPTSSAPSAWTSRWRCAAGGPATPAWPAATSTRSATSRPGSPATPTAATLSAFLAYLAAAEDEERGLTPGEVEVVEGAVQILTAHAAKGLEWDVVAVAGLTDGVWPGTARGSRPLPAAASGVLPFPLRGDADGLPGSTSSTAADQKDGGRRALTRFDDGVAGARRAGGAPAGVRRGDPARGGCCSAPATGGARASKRPRGPSVFLDEIARRVRRPARAWSTCGRPSRPDETNPTAERGRRAPSGRRPARPRAGRRWPRRRPLVRRLEATRARRRRRPLLDPAAADDGRRGWAARGRPAARRAGPAGPPARPARGRAAGAPVGLAARAAAPRPAARWPARCAGRCRDAPDPYARRGTAFHAWLEQRFGAVRLLDLDELPGAADDGAAPDDAARPRCRRRSWPASGPTARRSRSRCRSPPSSPGWWSAAGWTRCSPTRTAGSTSSTGRPARRPPARRRAPRPRCSSPRTGWPGRSWPACRSSGSGPAFHYVRDGATVRPADLLDADGLTALITAMPKAGDDLTTL